MEVKVEDVVSRKWSYRGIEAGIRGIGTTFLRRTGSLDPVVAVCVSRIAKLIR